MANKISVLIDVAVDKAVSNLKNFRTSIANAQGVGDKFKAGWQSATDSVKQNAGALATAGGAALLAFGVKAVAAFTDAALAAENAGKAMGTSTEQASRWIAVGDDFGLTAEQVAAGLGKVTTTINDSKWDKYTIATRDASGAARDANEILLDTFDALSKETNLTERSRMAKELLGKGYANLAPLIGKTRDELEGYLSSVEDGQVITQEEADRAREMALAQDALSDALGEVTLAAGSVIAKFAPLIERMADAITTATELSARLGVVGDVLEAEAKFLTGDFTGALSGAVGAQVDFKLSAEELEKSLRAQGVSQENIVWLLERQAKESKKTGGEVDDLAGSTDDLGGAVSDANREIDEGHDRLRDYDRATTDANDATRNLVDSVARLRGELDQEQAALDYKQAINDFAQSMRDAKGDTNAQAQALLDFKRELLDYLGTIDGVPTLKQTQIVAMIDAGKLLEAAAAIDQLVKERTVTIKTQISGSSGGKAPAKLPGGGKASESVGMAGDFGGGGGVMSAGPISITINGANKDARQLWDELAAEGRRRGVAWLG